MGRSGTATPRPKSSIVLPIQAARVCTIGYCYSSAPLARTATAASGHLEGQFHQPDCGCDSCSHAVTAPVLKKPHGATCDDSCSKYGVPVLEEQDLVGELGGHA